MRRKGDTVPWEWMTREVVPRPERLPIPSLAGQLIFSLRENRKQCEGKGKYKSGRTRQCSEKLWNVCGYFSLRIFYLVNFCVVIVVARGKVRLASETRGEIL